MIISFKAGLLLHICLNSKKDRPGCKITAAARTRSVQRKESCSTCEKAYYYSIKNKQFESEKICWWNIYIVPRRLELHFS